MGRKWPSQGEPDRVKPQVRTSRWATDRTLLISGYGMLVRGWSRLKWADLPAFWVF
jgi:hypothetical protein